MERASKAEVPNPVKQLIAEMYDNSTISSHFVVPHPARRTYSLTEMYRSSGSSSPSFSSTLAKGNTAVICSITLSLR